MQRDSVPGPQQRRAHPLLFFALTGLLVAFAVWCLVLLFRSDELRRDLDFHLGWIDEVRRLRADLDRIRWSGPPTAAGGDLDLRLDPIHFPSRRSDPALQVAVRSLDQALERLCERWAEGDPDRVWDALVAALTATSALEGRLQGQVSQLHGRLGDHWVWLNVLVLASLLLAASNLALMRLAHRRRVGLEQAHAEVLRQASHDPLTGLWNREGILNLLRHELARAQRHELPVGVILADIDTFRRVNVQLGEEQGDFLLQQLAARLGSQVRPYDTLGRFGGDSFLVVLPSCGAPATENVAGRLAETVNGEDIEHALGKVRLTVSLAHTTVSPRAMLDADLILHRLQGKIDGLRAEGGTEHAARV